MSRQINQVYRKNVVKNLVKNRFFFGYLLFVLALLVQFQNCSSVIGRSFHLENNNTQNSNDPNQDSSKIDTVPLTADQIYRNIPCTDGVLSSSSVFDRKLYFSGRFTQIGICKGFGVHFNSSTGQPGLSADEFDGVVRVALSDGIGGWYVGGDFKSVGGIPRVGLAHINKDGLLDKQFDLKLNGSVSAMTRVQNTLYIAGNFTVVQDQVWPYFVAYDLDVSKPLALHPSVSTGVKDLIHTGTTLIFGGSFNRMGVATFGHAAKIDISGPTALVASNFPVINGVINDVVADGAGGWYVGGNFSHVGATLRKNLVHILNDNSVDTGWNFDTDAEVNVLHLKDGKLFVGGKFNQIGGINRNLIAMIDTASRMITDWNPNIEKGISVSAVMASATKVYIGGSFDIIAGVNRKNLAEINISDSSVSSWDAGLTSNQFLFYISSLILDQDTLYIGGVFDGIKSSDGISYRRTNIASVNVSNYSLTGFQPGFFGTVNSMIKIDSQLFVGGKFSSIATNNTFVSRENVFSIDVNTQSISNWAPNPNNVVTKLINYNDRLFVAGNFTVFAGQTRLGFAETSVVTGALGSLNSYSNGQSMMGTTGIRAIAINNNTLIIGGDFGFTGGTERNNVAEVNVVDGSLTSFNPNADASINTMALDSHHLYLGGQFKNIGGYSVPYLAAISRTSGLLDRNWYANTDAPVNTLRFRDSSSLIVGGEFTNIGGVSQNYLGIVETKVGTSFGVPINWKVNIASFAQANSGTSQGITSFSLSGNRLFLVGNFSVVNGQERRGIAQVDLDSGSLMAWYPQVIASYNFIASNGNFAFVGLGSTLNNGNLLFPMVNTYHRDHVGAYDLDSGRILDFNANVNGEAVNVVSAQMSGVYLGGKFSRIGTEVRLNFASVDRITGVPTNLIGHTNGEVKALEFIGNRLFIGGIYTTMNSVGRGNLSSIDISNGQLTNWNPNLTGGGVYTLYLDGSKLFVGGSFIDANGSNGVQLRVAAFDTTSGGLITSWNPGVSDGAVMKMLVVGDQIIIGGTFNTIAGITRTKVAALDKNTGVLSNWAPYIPDGSVANLLNVQSKYLLINGSFGRVNNRPRYTVALFDQANGRIMEWNPVKLFEVTPIYTGFENLSYRNGYVIDLNKN